jgi:PiT family inorganic phosphate transporter
MEPVLLVAIILALLFNFVNGLNDAANAIATVIATRVLTPLQAVLMAACFNFIGPLLFTTAVAKTIGQGIVQPEYLTVPVLCAGILAAVVWVYISTQAGLPISATHAMVGGLLGSAVAYAGLAAGIWPSVEILGRLVLFVLAGTSLGAAGFTLMAILHREAAILQYAVFGALAGIVLIIPAGLITGTLPLSGFLAIVVFIAVSPLLGFMAAFLLGLIVIRLFRHANQRRMNFVFSKAQIFSAAFYSIGHGSNDAQNAMGVITATLLAAGILSEFVVPFWVIILSCTAIAMGTFLGGRNVIRTMGLRITTLRPYQGFCAETGGGVALSFITAFGVPVSTTHAISGAIMGVGSTMGYAAVQWGLVRRIVAAWIFTIPLTGIVAYLSYHLLNLFLY